MEPRLLHPVDEAQDLLGIGRSTLYGLIASGEISIVKIGRRTLVPHDELVRYARTLVDVEHGAPAA